MIFLSAGATESEYRVYNINNRGMSGVYMCLVSNNHNGQVLSKGAVLQIGEIANLHNHFGRSLCENLSTPQRYGHFGRSLYDNLSTVQGYDLLSFGGLCGKTCPRYRVVTIVFGRSLFENLSTL